MRDSGKRTQFENGAIRDTAEGKSRPDLISVLALQQVDRDLSNQIEQHSVPVLPESLYDSVDMLEELRRGAMLNPASEDLSKIMWLCGQLMAEGETCVYLGTLPAKAHTRLGQWCREGAEKYNDRNWEKGMPLSRFLASLHRHLIAFAEEDDEEDNLAAIMWNAMAAIHVQEAARLGYLDSKWIDWKGYKSVIQQVE